MVHKAYNMWGRGCVLRRKLGHILLLAVAPKRARCRVQFARIAFIPPSPSYWLTGNFSAAKLRSDYADSENSHIVRRVRLRALWVLPYTYGSQVGHGPFDPRRLSPTPAITVGWCPVGPHGVSQGFPVNP